MQQQYYWQSDSEADIKRIKKLYEQLPGLTPYAIAKRLRVDEALVRRVIGYPR